MLPPSHEELKKPNLKVKSDTGLKKRKVTKPKSSDPTINKTSSNSGTIEDLFFD